MEIFVDSAAFLEFRSKGLGRMMVSGGGFLLAIKEMQELLANFTVAHYFFWITVVVMAYISISYTVISARQRAEFNAKHNTSKAK